MATIFEIRQNLSKQANMKYTHIILDLGAAIKPFHVILNWNTHWKNIIIQLKSSKFFDTGTYIYSVELKGPYYGFERCQKIF